MRAMIVVTHLLGTGHLARALTLGRAFAEAGHAVRIVSGGRPAPQLDASGLELVQLPPLRSDGTDFARLLDDSGAVAGPETFETRKRLLCDALARFAPDILITELFPFGRRILAGEFLALLDAAKTLPRVPVILASLRDILAPPSSPAKAARTEAQVTRYYDAVLVHSDPRLTRLEQSWPVGAALAPRLRYTGYVAPRPPAPHPQALGANEILVSAGGGAVGGPLFDAAIAAARLLQGRSWRLLVGGGGDLAALRADAPQNLAVEPARPDFRQMLTGAAASVSLCGYNTALDLLQTGVPAVLVPFDAGREVEQGLRADSLASLPGIRVLRSAELTPAALAQAVAEVIAAGRRPVPDAGFDGAARSVALACAMAEARA